MFFCLTFWGHIRQRVRVLIETIILKHKKRGYAIPAQPHPKNKLYYEISRSFRL